MQEHNSPPQQSSPQPSPIEKHIFASALSSDNLGVNAMRITLDNLIDESGLTPREIMTAFSQAAARVFQAEIFLSGITKTKARHIISRFNFTSWVAMTATAQLAFHKREKMDESKRAPLHCSSGTAQSINTCRAPRPTAERVEPNFNE